jgi:hypothetical protein
VLSKSAEAGRLKPGTRVALMGIGSGLNCSMRTIELSCRKPFGNWLNLMSKSSWHAV